MVWFSILGKRLPHTSLQESYLNCSILLKTEKMPPPTALKAKAKPILHLSEPKKVVRFLANATNLETGSQAPVNTGTKSAGQETAQKEDGTASRANNKTQNGAQRSKKDSRSRSRSPSQFRRASSPYPGKTSSASASQRLETDHGKGRSRPVAQSTTSRPLPVTSRRHNPSPGPACKEA